MLYEPDELDQLGEQLAAARQVCFRLEARARKLSQLLKQLQLDLRKYPSDTQQVSDLLIKLTEDEAWTLQVLHDFDTVRAARLEDVLGYSDSRHVAFQLGPLQRFGLAVCQDGRWRLTRTGRNLAVYRTRLLKSGESP